MARNIIVMVKGEEILLYSTLTKICKDFRNFSYSYLKGKKYPFEYDGYKFIKQTLN